MVDPNGNSSQSQVNNLIFRPNTTQIPNVILDYWMGVLSSSELKVLLFICRKTFGWHKIRDAISLQQIISATKLSRQGVINCLEVLVANQLVTKVSNTRTDGGDASNSYEINVLEPHDLVRPTPKNKSDLSKTNDPPPQSTELTPPSQLSRHTKETNNKIQKKEIYKESSGPPRSAQKKPLRDEHSADASALSKLFFNKIKEKNQKFSKSIVPTWHKNMDILLKHRSYDEIERLIDFVLNDLFWQPIVVHPKTLWKNLDTIEAQMNSKKASSINILAENREWLGKIKPKLKDCLDVYFSENEIVFCGGQSQISVKLSDINFKKLVADRLNLMKIKIS